MKRRHFLKTVAGSAGAMLTRGRLLASDTPSPDDELVHRSPSMELHLSNAGPEILRFNVDGLGKGRRGANIVDESVTLGGYEATAFRSEGSLRTEYRMTGTTDDSAASWSIEASAKKIFITSSWREGSTSQPFTFRFSLPQVHSTVLGVFGTDGLLKTPVLMHFPGQGSVRVTCSANGVGLPYHSERRKPIAMLALPAATSANPRIAYTLDVTAIYPMLPELENDVRFDAFRRNWLNALQLNPSLPALANNTASTSCAFCYYEYADIAALTPPLADGLTAMDVVLQTLDRILAGAIAYGLPAPGNFPTAASDAYPAMIIAAANCVRDGKNDAWLMSNYAGIRGWAESMLATDKDGNGLMEYSISGNSGIWPDGFPNKRPSNWWDTIGFGHEDAYANELAFRALGNMASMAKRIGKLPDAEKYQRAADKIRAVFYKRFFNPETGVLGGWRSADGELHDYYFLWVNGIAIHYGLVPEHEANLIMDKLLNKMKEVGYDKFNMGLPGNLITVALKDYVHKDPDGHHGGGVRPDNADGFQNYENGGATGCFAFFTLAALYDLGRKAEADQILFAMLGEYDRGGFEGRGKSGASNDWRRWDGTPKGYEGFLVDNYYTLLAVPVRQSQPRWKKGYRPETSLS